MGNGGTFTASLCGSSYDTKIDIYTGTCGSLTSVACNDDFSGCGLQSQVSWPAANGTTYLIRVHGFGGASGNYTLNVTCVAAALNDLCTGAIPIACGQTINSSTSGMTSDPVSTCAGVTLSGSPGVWYTFVGDGQTDRKSVV